MAFHRILLETPDLAPGEILQLDGEEARHAAGPKRLRPGDEVQILNGAGLVATASIDEIARGRSGPVLHLRILRAERVPPVAPALTVFAATPKGGRVDELVDSLSQVGAAAWRPLAAARTVVDPRPGKLERLSRLAAEAAKQSGRAWLLQIGRPATVAEALTPLTGPREPSPGKPPARPGETLVLADASGEPYQPSGAPAVHLLIGPEGGFELRELDQARASGAQIASFGPHVMRIETAAVAAAAIILNAERVARVGNVTPTHG